MASAADPAAPAWYRDDCAASRREFLARGAALAQRSPRVERSGVPVASAQGVKDRAVEALYVPAKGTPRRLPALRQGGLHLPGVAHPGRPGQPGRAGSGGPAMAPGQGALRVHPGATLGGFGEASCLIGNRVDLHPLPDCLIA
jgi:hypothetical protein